MDEGSCPITGLWGLACLANDSLQLFPEWAPEVEVINSLTGTDNKLVYPQSSHLGPISIDYSFLPLSWKTVLIDG